MKILVIGGSGLIGWQVVQAAQAAGHLAVGTYRENSLPGLVRFDAREASAFDALLREHQPDAVIHAAGFTWVDGCEDQAERAFEENALQPERLARAAAKQRAHFTYLSTSYIFDGQDGPYTEDAMPHPINVYSRSKWDGEQRVLSASGGAALIPRVICVFGAEARRKNFAFQVLRAMSAGQTMRLPADQEGNPSDARDLARWIIALVGRQASGPWHLGGPQPACTRPAWAELLVQAFASNGVARHPGFAVQSVPTSSLQQRAPRPLRAGMLTRKLDHLGIPPTPFDFSIREMLRQDREWFPPLQP